MHTKKKFNRFQHERLSIYFQHYRILSDYVKGNEIEYEHLAYVTCKELDSFYIDANKWFRYFHYRLRYETPIWWSKRQKKAIRDRFPEDISNMIIQYVI